MTSSPFPLRLGRLLLVLACIAMQPGLLSSQARVRAAELPSQAGEDTAALRRHLAAAQRAIVGSFATGDTTGAAPFWCADYVAIGGMLDAPAQRVMSRDSVLRQFTAANRSVRPAYRFAPVIQDDTAGMPDVRLRGDTAAIVVGQYWQDRVGSTAYEPRQVTVMHEFRRRPSGWCAVRGYTVSPNR